jgi:glycosyltransferase involved in cell wall biosynthesis
MGARQLRVLLLHNRYQVQGGEDIVVAQEAALLRSFGIPTDVFEIDNDAIVGSWQKISTAIHLSYSIEMRAQVRQRIEKFRADILHVHNFFPRFTPSVYDAGIDGGCAVIQTLHNYRLMCPGGYLFRDNRICTDCLTAGNRMPSLLHRCYRGSFVGTAALSGMVALHQIRGTWETRVDRFITLTEFARDLFIEHAKLPPQKVLVKANLVPDLGMRKGEKHYALFVGRLSPEKGIDSILAGIRSGRFPLPLKVVGSGAMEGALRACAEAGKLEFLGKKSSEEVHELMRNAQMVLAPSIWHEAGVPLVIGEAFSAGVPVITSRIKPMDSVVVHEGNGLLVTPGSEAEICDMAIRINSDSELRSRLSAGARKTYERLYQPEANFRMLIEVYLDALRAQKQRQ